MDNAALLILLQLLLAHVLTDFVLQPTKWVMHKRQFKEKSLFLYLHSIVAGLLTYLLIQKWHFWAVPLVITVTHFFIDLWKLYQKDNFRIFILDQVMHLVVLLLAWLYIIEGFEGFIPQVKNIFSSSNFLIVGIAYLLVIFPVGFIIGKATLRWQNEIEISNSKTSLEAAGRYIGIFERILVLTFVLLGNFSAIGFLIAAKSILRFNDKTESGARKQTEYVLIGTLMSFAISIIIGLLTRYLLVQ
ncbi:MAG TPA: DUF3307 domain-containing protein [Salinimicrobium sp.]|nr:DUF3307 domain-containing protein [Salinimicrobium sp.]